VLQHKSSVSSAMYLFCDVLEDTRDDTAMATCTTYGALLGQPSAAGQTLYRDKTSVRIASLYG